MTCCFACWSGVARANPEADSGAERSAGVLLHRGFELFRRGNDGAAVGAFGAAVASGNLNDAGRALAYWYIFVAEQHAGHEDLAAEALGCFVVVAQDVLHDQASWGEAPGADDFTVRFDLPRRLARARATLSAVWAGRTSSFGRRSSQPILIHDATEKAYFLELAMPCAHSQQRRISSRISALQPHIEEVRVRCSGAAEAQQSYYFQTLESSRRRAGELAPR